MASTPPPPPVIGKAGNLTVFITPPPATPSQTSPCSLESEAGTPRSEFTTPPTSPRATDSPASPPPEMPASPPPPPPPPPVRVASPRPFFLPNGAFSTPPLLKTVSPSLPAARISQPPPVQVPPPQYERASADPDGSVLAFFWDAVARMQEAHASLDEYISNWFGLDQSKYQWALNDYYERTGQEMDSGKASNPKEVSSKLQKV